MNRYILFFPFLLLPFFLLSCDPATDQESSEEDISYDEYLEENENLGYDEVPAHAYEDEGADPDHLVDPEGSLGVFTPENYLFIVQHKEDFETAGNAETMMDVFRRITGKSEELASDIGAYAVILAGDNPDEGYMHLQEASEKAGDDLDLVMGMDYTEMAEGTEPYFAVDYAAWRDQAKETEGEEDEKMFGLGYKVYANTEGVDYGYGAYFVQTWDYGGYTLLGEGIHTDLLVQCDELITNGTFSGQYATAWKEQILHDAVMSNEFGYSKEKAIEEIENIMAKVDLDQEWQEKLETRVDQINGGDSKLSFGQHQN